MRLQHIAPNLVVCGFFYVSFTCVHFISLEVAPELISHTPWEQQQKKKTCVSFTETADQVWEEIISNDRLAQVGTILDSFQLAVTVVLTDT